MIWRPTHRRLSPAAGDGRVQAPEWLRASPVRRKIADSQQIAEFHGGHGEGADDEAQASKAISYPVLAY